MIYGCFLEPSESVYSIPNCSASWKSIRKLEREMYGVQLWFLIKEQSVRGMKIVIDDSVKSYVIVGTKFNKES